MAPSSALYLFLLAAVAAGDPLPPPPCANVSGLYAIGDEATEVLLQQGMSCNFTGMDNGGSNVSGMVNGTRLMLMLAKPGQPVEMRYGMVDPNTSTINISAPGNASMLDKVLRKIDCPKGFAGLWSNGQNILAISEDPKTCTGRIYSAANPTQGFPTTFMGFYMIAPQGNALWLQWPATLTNTNRTPYQLIAPIPCFKSTDFNLTQQCFNTLANGVGTGAWMSLGTALANRQMNVSQLQTRYCAGGGMPATCMAPCVWQMEGQGYGHCSCPDEPSCVASGLGWVTPAYPCDASFIDTVMMASADCCGGKPDICEVMGTAPVTNQPSPSPGQGAGCGRLPGSLIRSIEDMSKMVVKRCPVPPPSPPYGGPGPSPYMPPPSPSMYAPPPSPSYMR